MYAFVRNSPNNAVDAEGLSDFNRPPERIEAQVTYQVVVPNWPSFPNYGSPDLKYGHPKPEPAARGSGGWCCANGKKPIPLYEKQGKTLEECLDHRIDHSFMWPVYSAWEYGAGAFVGLVTLELGPQPAMVTGMAAFVGAKQFSKVAAASYCNQLVCPD